MRPSGSQYSQDLLISIIHIVQLVTVLPQRDQLGRRIAYMWFAVWDPPRLSFAELYPGGYMLLEMMALEPKTQVRYIVCQINVY